MPEYKLVQPLGKSFWQYPLKFTMATLMSQIYPRETLPHVHSDVQEEAPKDWF